MEKKPAVTMVTCPKCNGAGVVTPDGGLVYGMMYQDSSVEIETCRQCDGKGRVEK